MPYPAFNPAHSKLCLTINGTLFSAKNSKQIAQHGNRPIIIKSKAALAAEPVLIEQLHSAKPIWQNYFEPKITYPQCIGFYFYRKTNHPFDYVNIIQSLLDCMQLCGYIPEDNMNHINPIFLGWTKDSNSPRTEIYLIHNAQYIFAENETTHK